MEAPLLNQEAKEVGTVSLPVSLFGMAWNPTLVQSVIEGFRAGRRKGTAHAKGRGEVRGGGKKPWRQKGTGRARHGSIRSSLWSGGGVTHGPTREKVYAKKVNKKERRKALASILSRKLHEGEVVFIESLAFEEPKTKLGAQFLEKFRKASSYKNIGVKGGRTLFVLARPDRLIFRTLRNIPFVSIDEARGLNAEKIATPHYVVFTKEAVRVLEK